MFQKFSKVDIRKVAIGITAWGTLIAGLVLMVYAGLEFYKRTEIAPLGTIIDADLTGAIGSFLSGTVGVLFSMSAVLFFFMALTYQEEELSLQRKELTTSTLIFKQQQFETTFFNLLRTQQEIRLQ